MAFDIDEAPILMTLISGTPFDVDEAVIEMVVIDETAVCSVSGASMAPWILISPTELSALGVRDPIVLEAQFTEDLLLSIVIAVRIQSLGTYEVIYAEGSFSAKYAGLSRMTPTADGRRFSIRPASGWPREVTDSEEDDIELLVSACLEAVPPVVI